MESLDLEFGDAVQCAEQIIKLDSNIIRDIPAMMKDQTLYLLINALQEECTERLSSNNVEDTRDLGILSIAVYRLSQDGMIDNEIAGILYDMLYESKDEAAYRKMKDLDAKTLIDVLGTVKVHGIAYAARHYGIPASNIYRYMIVTNKTSAINEDQDYITSMTEQDTNNE